MRATLQLDGWDTITGITVTANGTCRVPLTGAVMVTPGEVRDMLNTSECSRT